MACRFIGKIFRAEGPLLSLPAGTDGALLAITEPDAAGQVGSLLVSPDGTLPGETMKLPSGMLSGSAFLHLDRYCLTPGSSLNSILGQVDETFLEQALRTMALRSAERHHAARQAYRQSCAFIPGTSRVNYAGRVYDADEVRCLVDASLDFYLTADRYDREFCKGMATFLQSPTVPQVHLLTVNSGSSANLLALSALTSPKLGDLALKRGDEVITVSAGFPTSIGPIVQNGLVPVFVDIELGTYNVNTDQIERSLSPRTKAIMLAHTLGIPFDADRILEIAERMGLWVIEDNCDALGAEYNLAREYRLIHGKTVSGTVQTGTLGHIGTSSFYPAHQITMGEGGAVYTSDRDLYRIALSFRDWGRDCWCEPGRDDTCTRRFGWRFGLLPEGYDHKYVYSHLGYNLKITDMQAAIGVAQLRKLPGFAASRYGNWKRLRDGLADLDDVFLLPHHSERSLPSPFGFALTVREGVRPDRNGIVSFLESRKIQTRPVFAGNMLRQPAFTGADIELRIMDSPVLRSRELREADIGILANSDAVMERTFWIGVYPGMTGEMIEYSLQQIRDYALRGRQRT